MICRGYKLTKVGSLEDTTNMPTTDLHTATIAINYSRWLARALELKECDLPLLFQHSGLHPDCLNDPRSQLTLSQQMVLLNNAFALSNDPEFSLRLGQLLNPSSHGPLGYLILSSPDLKTAIDGFVQFLPARIPFVTLRIESPKEGQQDDLIAYLEIDAQLVGDDNCRHLMENCIVTMQGMVEHLLGRPLQEARGEFSYPDPGLNYAKYLHFPVAFNAPITRFIIPGHLLASTNISPDYDSYAFALQQCQQQLQQLKNLPVSSSRQAQSLLLSHPPGHLTEQQVADQMFITKRTLARRLSAEETSFRQLKDSYLGNLASRYLHDTTLSVATIAAQLNYHDSASFRRAFKRWFGRTPQQYRLEKE